MAKISFIEGLKKLFGEDKNKLAIVEQMEEPVAPPTTPPVAPPTTPPVAPPTTPPVATPIAPPSISLKNADPEIVKAFNDLSKIVADQGEIIKGYQQKLDEATAREQKRAELLAAEQKKELDKKIDDRVTELKSIGFLKPKDEESEKTIKAGLASNFDEYNKVIEMSISNSGLKSKNTNQSQNPNQAQTPNGKPPLDVSTTSKIAEYVNSQTIAEAGNEFKG